MSLNEYQLLYIIGEGCDGLVYRAIDSLGRVVAIKKTLIIDPIHNEVKMHSEISHLPFIPTLYQHFIVKTNQYLVMELIKGQSLCQSWRGYKSWDHIWMTTLHALQVIRDLHNAGYYHGDLHLNNLMWTGENMWLIDLDSVGLINYECGNMNQQHRINNKIRSDYMDILNITGIRRYGTNMKNDNHSLERYQLLCELSMNIPCNGTDKNGKYVTDSEYVSRLIEEHDIIDRLIF